MAEAFVSYTVGKIGDLLIHEAVFLYDVREKVELLQSELKRMQCFLEDAESKQEEDARVRNWVEEIRNVAYDAEDVIDNFIHEIAPREDGLRRVLKRFAFTFTKVPRLRRIGNQIKSIETKIEGIKNSRETYDIKFSTEGKWTSSISEMQRQMRRTHPRDVVEDDVITLDDSTKDLMDRLMDDEDDRLRVVPIAGMAGLGKTTLAKKVYNQKEVKQYFDCQAWAFVSQQPQAREVMYAILRQIISPSNIERDEDLILRLYEELTDTRYLIVLDDIWNLETWLCLKGAFPDEKKGSKIVFTTRNKDVASRADPGGSFIEPPLLTDEQSWELLRKKAFNRRSVDGHDCSPEFEKLGREMVKECRGLPLAIVVLGGLLAEKRSSHEWMLVQKDITRHLQQQHGGLHGILALSYQDLPHYLKPCFLYMGVFPEDSEIYKRELIRLWIAEGFMSSVHIAEEEESCYIEDLAEKYLEELVSRCMLQVDKKDHTGRSIKSCRIHDILRDFSVLKGIEFNFLKVIQTTDSSSFSPSSIQPMSKAQPARRVSIYIQNNCERYVPLPKTAEYPHLRSLLYFVRDRNMCVSENELYQRFSLLRVLRLDFVRLANVPKEICNLIQLRYLGLRETKVSELPRSIGYLRSLHTLDVRNNYFLRPPPAILRLKRLRHLLYSPPIVGSEKWGFQVENLTNLVTVKHLNVDNLIRSKEGLKLRNLQNLGITCERSAQVDKILESPCVKSGCLRTLNMVMKENSPFPENLEPLSQCFQLSKLTLEGRIPDDPNSHQHRLQFLPNSLAKLILVDSELYQNPLEVLEKLPNLRFLRLGRDSFLGSEMASSAVGFLQLETLEFHSLIEVEEWRVEDGSMPSLRTLTIDSMNNLNMIPEGLRSVSSLQKLNIVSMNAAFEKRLQVIDGIEGEDFYKVCHIPSISYDRTVEEQVD